MDIIAFSKNVKSFSKADILKTLGETRGMLETLGDPLKEFKANGFSMKTLLAALGQSKLEAGLMAKLYRDITLDMVYAGAVTGGMSLNKVCTEEFSRAKTTIFDGATLTIKQANVLLINSAIDLWVDYTNRLLQYGTTAMIKGKVVLDKPDANFFSANEDAYVDITRMLFDQYGVVVKRLKGLPELPVDEATVNVLQSARGKDAVLALPIRQWGIHTFTPVYWYGGAKMEFDLWRIKLHTMRIESNSMKIQQLRDIQMNNPSPATERAIETYENRIIKSQAQIESIQEYYDYHG